MIKIMPPSRKPSVAEDIRYKLVGDIHRGLQLLAVRSPIFGSDRERTAKKQRSEFTKLVDRFGKGFLDVYEKHPAVGWIDPRSGTVCKEIEAEVNYLVKLTCWRSGSNRQILDALAGWPGRSSSTEESVPAPSALLEANTMSDLCKAVNNRIGRKLSHPVANRTISKQRPRRRATRPSLIRTLIAGIKRDHPEKSSHIKQMCELLDRRPVPTPKNWSKNGKHTWSGAWADPEYRPRVKVYISSVACALEDQP